MQECIATGEERWCFLTPWTKLLCGWNVSVCDVALDDWTYRTKFDRIELALPSRILSENASLEHAQQTVEALELLACAFSINPESWDTALLLQCGCDSLRVPSGSAVRAEKRVVPRFDILCSAFSVSSLMTGPGLRFFHLLLGSTERSPAFHSAMRQLRALRSGRSDAWPTSCDGGDNPVAIRLLFEIWDNEDEDLADFVDFVKMIDTTNDFHKASTRPWYTIDRVELDVTAQAVTSECVRQLGRLMAEAPFVHFSNMCINPNDICCTRNELFALVTTLVTTYPTIAFSLGNIHFDDVTSVQEGADKAAKVALVTEALANCPTAIQAVNVGYLIQQAVHDRDLRDAAWRHIFGSLLRPTAASTIQTIDLESSRILQDESDAALVAAAAASSPGYRIPPALWFKVASAHPASLRASVGVFSSGIRQLVVSDSDRPISSDIATFIVQTCVNLELLDLENVELGSMETFYTAHKLPSIVDVVADEHEVGRCHQYVGLLVGTRRLRVLCGEIVARVSPETNARVSGAVGPSSA